MSTEGNRIVPNPPEPLQFPELALAALIVASGIYIVSEFDSKAGWLLASLLLLTIAFRYKKFGDELIGIVSPELAKQQTIDAPPNRGNVIVGPTGPVTTP